MAKLWLGKVRALFHFILSLRIDMKKRVYRNFDTPSFQKFLVMFFSKQLYPEKRNVHIRKNEM